MSWQHLLNMLRRLDMRLAVTKDVKALTIASEDRFDIVSTDLVMPGLDGAAATEIQRLQGHTTPVTSYAVALPNVDSFLPNKSAVVESAQMPLPKCADLIGHHILRPF